MNVFAAFINVGILYASFGMLLNALFSLIWLAYNYFKTKDKAFAKTRLKKICVSMVIGLLLFYIITFAGEYRRLDISEETSEQLLKADITTIQAGEYDFNI